MGQGGGGEMSQVVLSEGVDVFAVDWGKSDRQVVMVAIIVDGD